MYVHALSILSTCNSSLLKLSHIIVQHKNFVEELRFTKALYCSGYNLGDSLINAPPRPEVQFFMLDLNVPTHVMHGHPILFVQRSL